MHVKNKITKLIDVNDLTFVRFGDPDHFIKDQSSFSDTSFEKSKKTAHTGVSQGRLSAGKDQEKERR